MSKLMQRITAWVMTAVTLMASVMVPVGQVFARADPATYTASSTIGQFLPDSTCIAQGGLSGCGYYVRFADLEARG